MSIYSGSVNKPITTLMIFVAIIVMGIYSFLNLPIDFYPEMEIPAISVYTVYSGASAEDIETNVTEVIEDALNSVSNLKEISSVSKDNFSIVSLEFEWGTNLDEAANDIRNNLGFVSSRLPDEAEDPLLFKFNTSTMPIMFFAVRADASYNGLQKILEEKLVNPLKRVEGIGSVSVVGHPGREIYVETDPTKLDAYGLTLEQVGSAIAMQNRNTPLGNVEMGTMNFPIRVTGELASSEQISSIALGTRNGKTIYLRDVARVVDTLRDTRLKQHINGSLGASFFIQKQSGANTVKIAREVNKRLEEIKKTLPSDIRIEMVMDTSDFIMKSVNNLKDTIFYAMVFVVLVVLFFLGRWRGTIIVSLTIPISLIVSFIYLRITGGSLNIISLSSLSIALGMVVDDAIVVLENISRHIERGSKPREAAIYATNEVWLSVIVTTLTVLAVFMPLTFTSGLMGIMFKQLGWIVSITVTMSTLTAITLTPMLSSLMLKLRGKDEKPKSRFHYDNTILPMLNRFDKWYGRTLAWCLHHKRLVLGVLFLIFFASLFLITKVGTEFVPQNDQSSLQVHIELQSGTRASETFRFGQRIDSMIMNDYPELRLISTSAGVDNKGSMSDLFQETGNHIINSRLRFKNVSERNKSVFDIADELRAKLATYPEIVTFNITSSSSMMGSSNSVDVEIYGFDFNVTTALAKEFADKIKVLPGVSEVNISRNKEKPELQIVFDQVKLSKHGLTTSAVSGMLRNRINGYTASKFRESGDEYDIVLRLSEEYRNDLEKIENIGITTPSGKIVRLKELGEVKEYWATPNIQRSRLERLVKVSAVPGKVSLGKLAKEIQKVVDATSIPSDVKVEVGGTYEDQQESFQSLALLLMLGLVLVYIVMASQFESFKMPFIIMFSIPFAVTGVFLALYITNTNLSIIAALGAVMLAGIVVKNAIVLVDYTNLMRERGYEINKAIVMAGESRLRPVLMTALTTILGMLPLALSTGEGSETWKGMGIAVVGGLTFSTLITMIVVPVVYAVFSKHGERDKKKAIQMEYHFFDAN
jgi:HAE1 family hydrophobic/amphiphilic exporter-1